MRYHFVLLAAGGLSSACLGNSNGPAARSIRLTTLRACPPYAEQDNMIILYKFVSRIMLPRVSYRASINTGVVEPADTEIGSGLYAC